MKVEGRDGLTQCFSSFHWMGCGAGEIKQFIRWFFSDNIFGSKAEIVGFFSICILLESVRAVEWHYNRGIGSAAAAMSGAMSREQCIHSETYPQDLSVPLVEVVI